MITANFITNITRGKIYLADLGITKGSEQGGIRPVIIVQNDKGNLHSGTVTIVPLTGSRTKADLPTHILLTGETCLAKESTALVEQIRTIDKERLIKTIGSLSEQTMTKIDHAIMIQMGLKPIQNSYRRFKILYRPQRFCVAV
jgi:mRNA interferase MazF